MNELAHVIEKRRLREGMIVLGLPEVELVYDDSGRVIDAHPEDTSYTHKLIEMFMVEANEAVARLFDSLHVPMIRRIHPDPDAHDITELRQFARVAGFNIPSQPSRKELQQLLDAVRGKPAQHAVHLAVLKTLSKAEYSPLLIGHFALASKHYTHFTSPIRRYPDLVVHRGLDAFFRARDRGGERRGQGTKGSRDQGKESRSHNPSVPRSLGPSAPISSAMLADPRCLSEDALTELGRHCSATERNAEAAESALRNYLVLDLLSQQLGSDYAGTVSGVTGGGAFLQIDHFLVDGFVKLDDLPGLPDDRWRLNRATGALVAQRSGRSITIGDRFTVRIARVNPHARQMDLVIVTDPAKEKKAYASKKPKREQPPRHSAPRLAAGLPRNRRKRRR
jgi:ribonuclease R